MLVGSLSLPLRNGEIVLSLAAILAFTTYAPVATALCSYNKVLYAKTTVEQEYRDSKWVAQVRVVSAKDNFTDRQDGPWSLYRLQVLKVFKGMPPNPVPFLTYRNSGGFYFEGAGAGASHADIGRIYLVFLNPALPFSGQPKIERGTAFVNYACGQSKRWIDVTKPEKQSLERLSTAASPTSGATSPSPGP